jgi:UDP-glucuronate 4-epimerase
MKILITGTAGFIGHALTKKLLERGDEVIGIDNINNYYDINLKYARLSNTGINQDVICYNKPVISTIYPKYMFVKLALEDKENLNTLIKDQSIDAVCNLAAQAGVRYSLENPDAYIQSNIIGFMNILEMCRQHKIKNLCYASSSSVYGLNKSQPFQTSHHTDHPVSLYAATKKANEMMAHSYSHLYAIQTTGLRFFTVYGPWGRPDMAPMLFASAITEKRPIKVFNHGNMSRDFTYIDDIVDGVINVIDNPATPNAQWDPLEPNPNSSSAPYRIYNIGNNQPISLMEFIETIEKTIGIKADKIMLPMQDGDVQSTFADVNELIQNFNYKPETLLKDGITEFVNWYKVYYSKNNL